MIGGGGAVGLAAVQLAVAAGCSVSATCGAQSIEQVLAAGAEKAIDYTAEVKNLQKSELLSLNFIYHYDVVKSLTLHYVDPNNIGKSLFMPLVFLDISLNTQVHSFS